MSHRIMLSVRNVSKWFGGLIAVNHLSFEINEHEVLGLIGPNGSGKTTVMNMISGALRPSTGQIMLCDQLISGRPAHDISRAGVARTFQLVRMLPGMTVLENVIAGGVFGHVRRWGSAVEDFARTLLARVGMKGVEHLSVSALTYIDQKRVELARALAGEPKILMLDEWLAGLNPTELKIGIKLIHELRAEGITIILVEHVMDAIRSLSDRCVVMNSGLKIAEGTPDEVLSNSEVIRAYLGDDNA